MSDILVVIALVFHLFPFRTEKLSPTAPMVLRKRESRSPPSFFKLHSLLRNLSGGGICLLVYLPGFVLSVDLVRNVLFLLSAALFPQ